MSMYKEIIATITNNDNTQAITTASALANADVLLCMSAQRENELSEAIKTMNSRPIVVSTGETENDVITETAAVEYGAYIAGCRVKGKKNYIDDLIGCVALIRAVLFTKANRITDEAKIAIAKAIASAITDDKLSNWNVMPILLHGREAVINVVCKVCEEMGKGAKVDVEAVKASLRCFGNEGYLLPV